MKWHCILLFLFLCAAAAPAAALNPVNVALTSSNGWVIADNTDSAIITVRVTDGANNAIQDALVTLDITQPWVLKDTGGKTDGSGKFVTTFLPTTKSGSAIITASVTVSGTTTVPVVQTFTQNIIAGTPYKETNSYSSTASVGSLTTISVLVTDRYGNPVDSRKNINQVTFIASSSGNSAFVDKDTNTKVKSISVALNDSGLASTDFLLDTKPGENYVAIQPPSPVPMTLISIEGIANLKPASITQTVTPGGNPPTVTTDGISKFTIEYRLYDQYGNPSTYNNLSISADTGEKMVISSNSEGKVTVSYGPKTPAGKYTITATALDNPAVTATQILQFANGNPTNMLLTASPQTMASRDVPTAGVSSVKAKVIDAMGNPVQGETVSFSIQSVNFEPFVQTQGPVIENGVSSTNDGTAIAAITDENGYATVTFYPGAFTTENPGYNAMAEGTAKIRATWRSVTQDLDLSYKNYPYLSVSTDVNPMTVETGKDVEVTIRLKGDGYALQPKPIDVMLVTDRSGTMLWDYPDRELGVMSAAKTFASKFDFSRDRMGQVSFGGEGVATVEDWPANSGDCGLDKNRADDLKYAINYKGNGTTYADYANLDLPLSSSITAIDSAIERVVPDGNTPMRYGLYKAITELKNNGNPNSVKAIVLLTDGDYNEWGDPLARGSTGSNTPTSYSTLTTKYYPFTDISTQNQNMSVYASANNIRIYTIGYGASLSPGGVETLTTLAAAAHGTYNHAMSEADLNNFYSFIRGSLMDKAGVNTRMELDFQNVEVNGVSIPNTESAVVEYVYKYGKSTWMVPPSPAGAYPIDSRDDWNGANGDTSPHQLSFKLGTIKVNEEWVVSFLLKVKEPGNIKILGSTSQVLFDNGQGTLSGTLTIPDTYVTGVPPLDTGLSARKLVIKTLRRTNLESDRDNANLAWEISYNGGDDRIEEEIQVAPLNSDAYSYRGSTSKDCSDASCTDTSDTYVMDISGLQPGVYKVKVTGSVSDADSSWSETQITIPKAEQRPEIVIR